MSSAGDELIDWLDDAGQVIGRVTRRQMRTQRLPHRCVYLLVFNSRGDLFVHQRTANKDVFPSHWDLTVGGVLTTICRLNMLHAPMGCAMVVLADSRS